MSVEYIQGNPFPLTEVEKYYVWMTLLAYSGNLITKIISPLLARGLGVQDKAGFYERGRREDDCAAYAFRRVLDEPWVRDINLRSPFVLSLYHDTQNFLQQRGYSLVEKPELDDLIAYGRGEITRPLVIAKHFGVFRSNDWVISKFGSGPVFRHRVQAIPKTFGNTVVFFHKTR